MDAGSQRRQASRFLKTARILVRGMSNDSATPEFHEQCTMLAQLREQLRLIGHAWPAAAPRALCLGCEDTVDILVPMSGASFHRNEIMGTVCGDTTTVPMIEPYTQDMYTFLPETSILVAHEEGILDAGRGEYNELASRLAGRPIEGNAVLMTLADYQRIIQE